MAITVTSKYKPFTYEELVKPLEGYWEKYDKEEAKLQEELNDLAKLKAIVDTAPEDNVDRQKFDKLYQDFQNSVDILADKGLSIENKNLFRALRQEYSAQVPRILVAEEDARKAKQEFMKLQNSGKYITPNNNNPGSFTWVNYLDGNIPTYDPAISKQEVLAQAKEYSAKISSKVTHDPIINSKALPGYSSITQKQGLKFDNPEEMLENPIMQNAYENILSQYNTEGWDDVSIKELQNNIKTGMFEGLYYDEKVDYHKSPKEPNIPGIPKVIAAQQAKVQQDYLNSMGVPNEYGNMPAMNKENTQRVLISASGKFSAPTDSYDNKAVNNELKAADAISTTIIPVYGVENDNLGQYTGVRWGSSKPLSLETTLTMYNDSILGNRVSVAGYMNMVNMYDQATTNPVYTYDHGEYWAKGLKKHFDKDDFIPMAYRDPSNNLKASAYALLPITGTVEFLSKNKNYTDFVAGIGKLAVVVNNDSDLLNNNSKIIDNLNNEIIITIFRNYLDDLIKSNINSKLSAEEQFIDAYTTAKDIILQSFPKEKEGKLYGSLNNAFTEYEKQLKIQPKLTSAEQAELDEQNAQSAQDRVTRDTASGL